MTNDKTVLHDKITGLVDGGNTAGHVGTAWTYYMLSPNWASALPNGSKPVAYGTANTNKIAILMTDGEYNQEHDSKGVATGSNGAGTSVNGTDLPTQARALCTSMKNSGIEVYTVGFDLGGNQTAINTLSIAQPTRRISTIRRPAMRLRQLSGTSHENLDFLPRPIGLDFVRPLGMGTLSRVSPFSCADRNGLGGTR